MKVVAGEIIFREGDESDVAYIIQSGRVEIFRIAEDGSTIQLAILEAGQMFGEMGPMDRRPRSASARALTETILIEQDIEAED